MEDLNITTPFKNYFYTIGLYYGEGARIRIGTTDYDLTRGSLLTIGPGMTCQWLNTSFPQMTRFFFYDDIFVNNFSRSFFYSLEFFCPDEKSVMQLTDGQFEEMQQLFSTLRTIADKPEAVSGILYSILIISQKYFWNLYRGNKRELNGKEHTVVKFRELVSKNFSQYKDVAFYAEQLHISPKYLSEILVEYTGLSAKKWIEFHIMQEAKYLLSFRNMSVKEVSFQLGYTDSSHFSRAFRSYDGQLPTEFKNAVENPV
ncbi:AraC family transcriptional regulator [Sphingobacterium sp. E70]|uniref:helix-turn-helix domain-containing protein n=1 Tax=Sphingobacterium sp. E70 TaxID=2853439 RepID=UPI00211C27E7|nr:AraC family transcriptional regulator [Sphingobacterium sp. E70]ULT23530.1 AraC family transcriptional regulator [Sphingobacterium sp. E70]